MSYQLTWVTTYLAVGYAPMSYSDLDDIKAKGIDAIVNLCGEFCDLHEIEEKSGFEVYFLPIPDECAPDLTEMEKALEWLDESIYLGKRVLVHCRHGIGRTGTFVTSYLLRRGMALKVANRKLKHTRAAPTNYSQCRLLKRYGKKSGILKIREPSLESRNVVNLCAYFAEYETLLESIDDSINQAKRLDSEIRTCGLEHASCCKRYLDLQLMEVIYLNSRMNRTLKSSDRRTVVQQAIAAGKQIRALRKGLTNPDPSTGPHKENLMQAYAAADILCPLNHDGRCRLYEYRPVSCRLHGVPQRALNGLRIKSTLAHLSKQVFFAYSGRFLEGDSLSFPLADTVSGRFVQEYFYYLASLEE